MKCSYCNVVVFPMYYCSIRTFHRCFFKPPTYDYLFNTLKKFADMLPPPVFRKIQSLTIASVHVLDMFFSPFILRDIPMSSKRSLVQWNAFVIDVCQTLTQTKASYKSKWRVEVTVAAAALAIPESRNEGRCSVLTHGV